MSPDQRARLKELFDDVMAQPAPDREQYLARVCGADHELRAELEQLLRDSADDHGELSGFAAWAGAIGEDAAPRFASGDVLAGRYRIDRLLSRGGMGEVYEAFDTELGVQAALKAIRPEIANSPDALTRFKQEIQMARLVTHPNVCRIYDLVQHDDTALLSMELIEGPTLAAYLKEHGPLTREQALPLIEQMAAALEAAHEAGVIHHDFKPGNVMITSKGGRMRAVVMDFGLSMPAAPGDKEHTGRRDGTMNYMAPEQLEGRPVTAATDVYALGLVIRAMTGGVLPGGWDTVVKRCLEREPAQRYARPMEVVARLGASGSRRSLWFATGVVAVVLAVAAQWWRTSPAPDGEVPPAPVAARPEPDTPTPPPAAPIAAAAQPVQFQRGNWILLEGFENRTGDPLYDNALKAALRRELSNSGLVSIAGQDRVDDVLRLMKKAPGTKLDRDMAREVALRDGGIVVLVAGSTQKNGQGYRFAVDLIDPITARVVKSIAEIAANAEESTAKIGRLSDAVLSALGEHKTQTNARHRELEKVTTPSLRAVELFDRADFAARVQDWVNVAQFSRAALAEDPNMASANLWLAWALKNLRQPEWTQELERARELSPGVTERERLFIEGSHLMMTNQQALAIPILEQLVKAYPDHYFGHQNLANAYSATGQFEKQHDELARSADLRPNDFHSQASSATRMGPASLGRAAQYARRAIALSSTADSINAVESLVFLIPFDDAWSSGSGNAAKELDRAVQLRDLVMKHQPPAQGYPRAVFLAYMKLGQVRAAREWLQKGVPEGPMRENLETLAAYWGGDAEEARRLLTTRRNNLYAPEILTIMTRLRLPDVDRLWANLAKQIGDGKWIQGETAMSQGNVAEAVRLLEEAFRENPSQTNAETLVDALEQLGDRRRSISVLEEAAKRPLDTVQGLRNLARLLQFYREAGMAYEARPLEPRLRRMLSEADPDFWMVKQLGFTR